MCVGCTWGHFSKQLVVKKWCSGEGPGLEAWVAGAVDVGRVAQTDSLEGKQPRDGARADGLGRGSGGEGCSAKWNHNRVELVEL